MKNIKKIITILMVFAMVFMNCFCTNLFAEERVPLDETITENTEDELNDIELEHPDSDFIENRQEQEDSDLPEDIISENNENTAETETNPQEDTDNIDNSKKHVQQGDSSLVQYFYVGSPYLTTPATQQFVLSFGSGTEGISSVKLQYQKDGGEVQELEATQYQNGLYVFEKSFTESETGTYKVNGFTYVISEQTYEVKFSDLQMDIRFGVNQEYEGYGTAEGYTVDENGNEVQEEAIDTQGLTDAEIETSIVSLDGSNSNEAESLVEDALQNNALPSSNARNRSNSISTYSETNPLVICIDPGHGGNDGGSTLVNGVSEKVYNLKIAQYLKAELEQYKNVKVVMTRTGDTNPSLQERAQIAANNGAKALVSIHLNATGLGSQTGTSGAEIYYPNTNYKPELSQTGLQMANNIMNQLTSLGIPKRYITVKYVYDEVTGNPVNDDRYDYPDGSVGDYYGVIRYSKLLGVAGIIVEHCYGDNWNDINNFLGSEDKIKKLGVADATGIANAFGLSKISREEIDSDGTYFIHSALNNSFVLDVDSGKTTNEANVQLYENNGTGAQGWKVTHDTKGYVTFINVNSGKVLDVNTGQAASGQNVQQYQSNGSYAQKWIVVKDGSSYKIVSGINSNYVLDLNNAQVVNAQNIQIYQSNNTKAQRWTFSKYQTAREALDSLASQNKGALSVRWNLFYS